jgi:Ca-activated chloride channel homolog
MRFEFPQHLWWFILIPVLFVLWQWAKQRNALILKSLGNENLLQSLIKNYDKQKENWKIAFLLSSLCCFVLAYANPQWGQKEETITLRQTDVVVALDVSKSMLAQDVLPNRLVRSKAFIIKLLEQIKAERIGIITFAENAYIQMPLTEDYAAAKMYFDAIETDNVSAQGTSIEKAIAEVEKIRAADKSKPVALLLISDGESHEDDAVEAAKSLINDNVLFFALGIGTSEGGFMMETNGVKKDESGNPIRTQLNEPMLQEIAASAKGKYFNISTANENTLNSIASDIKNIGKEGSQLQSYHDLESRFQYFLGLGFLLFCLYLMKKYNISSLSIRK